MFKAQSACKVTQRRAGLLILLCVLISPEWPKTKITMSGGSGHLSLNYHEQQNNETSTQQCFGPIIINPRLKRDRTHSLVCGLSLDDFTTGFGPSAARRKTVTNKQTVCACFSHKVFNRSGLLDILLAHAGLMKHIGQLYSVSVADIL